MTTADVPVNLHDLEPLGRARMPGASYDYVAGGAGDETSLRWNVERWSSVRLAPRNLVDVGRIDTTTTLLGHELAHPVLLAPVAAHGAYSEEAEIGTVRGAAGGEALYVQSTMASTSVEDVGREAASLGVPWWFQLYSQRDRRFTYRLVDRAATAGAAAMVLTVDTRRSARVTGTAGWGCRPRHTRTSRACPTCPTTPRRTAGSTCRASTPRSRGRCSRSWSGASPCRSW